MPPPIVTFIGWHSCGKTTLAAQVVRRLKERGYAVATVKSTKERGLRPDQEGTDTGIHSRSGAFAVALAAPDRLLIAVEEQEKDLSAIASRFFADADIVIGEGFKHADNVPKIEVRDGGPPLRGQVAGVIAVADDDEPPAEDVFGRNEGGRIADFIEARLLRRARLPQTSLLLDGAGTALNDASLRTLVAAVHDILPQCQHGIKAIEIRVQTDAQHSSSASR